LRDNVTHIPQISGYFRDVIPFFKFRHIFFSRDFACPSSIHAADTGILSLTSINIFISFIRSLTRTLSALSFFSLARIFSLSLSLFLARFLFSLPSLFSDYSQPSYSDLISFLSCTAKHLHDHSAVSTLNDLQSLIFLINRYNTISTVTTADYYN